MSKKGITGNRINQSLWLSTLVIAGLILLSFLPEIQIGSLHLRKTDIFSDLHPEPPNSMRSLTDSITQKSSIDSLPLPVDPSVTRIEDFSGRKKNLHHFYDALKKINQEPVRIAFYGDSFIEGDIISATLRDTLQKIFGGNGVGWVPFASETAGFRKSIKHTYSNWNTYTLITPEQNVPIGISGYTYTPQEDNVVIYKPGKTPPQPDFKMVRLYYQNTESGRLYYQINNDPETNVDLAGTSAVEQLTITHKGMASIRFRIEPVNHQLFFGASIEDRQGIYVDNFSLRRNSGIALSRLSPQLLSQFNKYLNYKLIILQYGLNVAAETDSTHYAWYADKMVNIIKNLKAVFPETTFLLMGVSDRGINKEGRMVTMDAIPRLRDVQREIAKKSGIAFWDTFMAMGGKNSIAGYTEAVPPLASKDYTHLNHSGGQKLGKKLADALLLERRSHEK